MVGAVKVRGSHWMHSDYFLGAHIVISLVLDYRNLNMHPLWKIPLLNKSSPGSV